MRDSGANLSTGRLLSTGLGGEWDHLTNRNRNENMEPAANKRLLTMADIKAGYGISKASLSRAINGKLANCTKLLTVRVGRRAFVRPESMENWVKENEK